MEEPAAWRVNTMLRAITITMLEMMITMLMMMITDKRKMIIIVQTHRVLFCPSVHFI